MHRALGFALVLASFVACSIAQDAPAPTRPDLDRAYLGLGPGPRGVDAVPATLEPTARGERPLPLLVYVPREGGPYPLVLFSHGLRMDEHDYRELARYWAGHGYVVVLPRHEDLDPPETWERRTPLSPRIDYLPNVAARCEDLRRVLDGIPALVETQPRLAGRIDIERVAAAGHSFGTLGAQLLAGAVSREEQLAGRSDERIDALLVLAAFGRGAAGFDEGSWASFDRPLLALTGSEDPGPSGEPSEARLDPALLAPPARARAFLLPGTDHFAYLGSRGRASPRLSGDRRANARVLRDEGRRRMMLAKPGAGWSEGELRFAAIRMLTLAFLDASLKDSERAAAFLDSEAAREALPGLVEAARTRGRGEE